MDMFDVVNGSWVKVKTAVTETVEEVAETVETFVGEVVDAVKDEGETIEENFKDFVGIEEQHTEETPAETLVETTTEEDEPDH